MKFIIKENILSTICISFTCIILAINLLQILESKSITPAQVNLFYAFLWTAIAVIILSLHHYLEKFSPLLMIAIQYIIALSLVLLSVWILKFFIPISTHWYRDVFISFSSIYVLGAFIYYVELILSVRRQNKTLEYIKVHKNKKEPSYH